MDLEQRVGRVHRFGSRETILVDTIVVAGTRESDAYRIAREKLHRIVTNLAPGAFEALFSRVMSLVAPEELAGALSASPPWLHDGDVETRIADIVSAGFNRWSEFTARFAENESLIRHVDPGAAEWQDLRDFLERTCNAEYGPAATRPVFTLNDQAVGMTEASVRTLNVFGGIFVCDETDGLPAEDISGQAVRRIGTAHADVIVAIRTRLSKLPEDRIGSIRLGPSDKPGWPGAGASIILIYAAQRVELVGTGAEERELQLEVYTLTANQPPSGYRGKASGNWCARYVPRNDKLFLMQRCSHPDLLKLTSNSSTASKHVTLGQRAPCRSSAFGLWPVSQCRLHDGIEPCRSRSS